MKIKPDKIASSTKNAKLNHELILSENIVSKEGYIIAVKVLNDKSVYNNIELVSGRMSRVFKGDVVVGVLGARNALKGYSGVVPDKLKAGDTIQLLNLGGVMGKCTSDNPELGQPFDAEVLGAILHFPSMHDRVGTPANILNGAVSLQSTLAGSAPLVLVSGTCMQAGKTRAVCEIIKQLTRMGHKVGAAKLTGISLMRDTLEMADFGAVHTLNFTDAGIVSTNPSNVVDAAKGIVQELNKGNPDCIVLELGDGIMGEYGVMNLLQDIELMSFVKAHVLAANDQVGTWGAVKYLSIQPHKVPTIDIVCGPATDNEVGKKFIQDKLGVHAANAIKDSLELGKLVSKKVFGKM